MGGSASFWAGVLQSEAEALCFHSGQGYGNSWSVCIGKEFDYAGTFSAILDYDFRSDTEAGFDFTEVLIDTSGGDRPRRAAGGT